MPQEMLVPLPVAGTINTIGNHVGYEWIHLLPFDNIYFALFQRWPDTNLPAGHNYYIVSFHLEVIDLDWVKKQSTMVDGPIFVLADGQHYNYNIPNVHFLSFYYWHYQLNQMQEWFGIQDKPTPTYKFSAVCNRISQSKVWITTKLLEDAKAESLLILSDWFEEKNVHNWEHTGNVLLDNLSDTFRHKWAGKQIKIDDFVNETDNKQSITGTPWQPLYTDAAVHFTNESFHYSNMGEYVWPGPFITEKTLKCLLGATAFIPVGQFDTYGTLSRLGLQFDYDFNTTWDADAGNITRSASIVDLIDYLNQYTVDQLLSKTQESSKYNQTHIVSGNFFKNCQLINNETIDKLRDLL